MMKTQLLAILSLLTVSLSFAQNGKIAGKITNNKNEAVTNASVLINTTKAGTKSNTDGSFIISLAPGTYSITISSVGYASKEINDIEVKAGMVTDIEIMLQESSKNKLQDVTIKAAAKKESTNAMIQFQKNTATVSQVISAEAIRRSPDKNTGEVLKRVPGTSVQEGKYLVVRGLADRYNQAMLNGILLSSTEPDRKTFSFDIFPASMIDNIIMNKAFVPELSGEWAGGLVQVNTKDIPSKNFFSIQLGTGFNTQTIGKDFYTYRGGKLDWLGIDDGSRSIPNVIPGKSKFAGLTESDQSLLGRSFKNIWTANAGNTPLNASFQLSGGFSSKLFGKKLGAVLALTYNRSNRRTEFQNSFISNPQGDIDFIYHNDKYSQDVLWGALGNFSIQLNSNNKISFKNILNVNSSDYVTARTGKDFILGGQYGQNIRANELGFKQNIFFNTQVSGDHHLGKPGIKLKWYGSFSILDQYIPDQRRLQYIQDSTQAGYPYIALIAGGNSQKSGSRFFSFLNDYVYNAGGDISKKISWNGKDQTIKLGYMFQVKDRLFDSRPFYYQINRDTTGLVKLGSDKIFAPQNITGENDNAVVFGELYGNQYRYLANTILNAAFIQFDNEVTKKLRVVWGVRMEHFDQLVGSVRQSDPRHVHSEVIDFLPGLNATYKLNEKTNLRLSGSQTVVRPEFRELSPFAFYDFELGATVVGNKNLVRTKITNMDLRFETYPRAGELFTVGIFYKYFRNPIELYFNNSGAGSSNTFNFLNADKANSFGVEVEARKKLDFSNILKHFTISGNVSYIYNRVKGLNLDRPMQGQSPYLINLGLQYDLEKAGLSATLLFNQIGRRILFVGNLNQSTGVGVPEIWENPRALLDLQVAKKILKSKGEIKLNISDLLNQHAYFYHDLDGNKKFVSGSKDAVAIDRRYGSNISLSFAYNIK